MEFVQVVGVFPWCRNHGKLGRVISQRSGDVQIVQIVRALERAQGGRHDARHGARDDARDGPRRDARDGSRGDAWDAARGDARDDVRNGPDSALESCSGWIFARLASSGICASSRSSCEV